MTEGLDIMDNSVNLSSLEFSGDIRQPLVYGVWVGVVGVLLSQRISGLRHSELTLNFIEYNPSAIILKVVIKVLGVDRRHADVG